MTRVCDGLSFGEHGMAELEKHLRKKLFLGAVVVAVAMAVWVLIINIAARH